MGGFWLFILIWGQIAQPRASFTYGAFFLLIFLWGHGMMILVTIYAHLICA
jgi:hypothetical protein